MNAAAPLPFSAWPAGRKVAAILFGLLAYLGLAAAAVFVSGALFLVLVK